MRILNAEPNGYSRKAYDILSGLGEVIEEDCNRSKLLELIPMIDILIVRLRNSIDAAVLQHAPNLKFIVSATTGLNHIDLSAAEINNIQVVSLKGERAFLDGLTATAELTWSLLLSLYRNIPVSYGSVQNGNWNRDLFKGNQLKDKVIGIVGFGRLGSVVAEYARAFQMKIITADPYVNNFPGHVEKVHFDYLLEHSDVISIHVPYDETTRTLFDRSVFNKIKPGAVLINTSRGEIIDEVAMIEAFDNGILSGIAVDVLSGEATNDPAWLESNPIWVKSLMHPNILITPHLGGATHESMEEAEIFIANKLAKIVKTNI